MSDFSKVPLTGPARNMVAALEKHACVSCEVDELRFHLDLEGRARTVLVMEEEPSYLVLGMGSYSDPEEDIGYVCIPAGALDAVIEDRDGWRTHVTSEDFTLLLEVRPDPPSVARLRGEMADVQRVEHPEGFIAFEASPQLIAEAEETIAAMDSREPCDWTPRTREERLAGARRIDLNRALAWWAYADGFDPYRESLVDDGGPSSIGREEYMCDPEERIPVLTDSVRQLHPELDDGEWDRLLSAAYARNDARVEGLNESSHE